MLHLKQTLHNLYTTISTHISQIKIDLKSLGVVPQSYLSAENLGKLLLNLTLLVSIALLTVATFILSLLWLLKTILKKSAELSVRMSERELDALYTSCHWEDDQKNTTLTSKKSQKHAWKEDGDLLPDSTSAYSEMPGGLDKLNTKQKTQLEKAMKAPIDQDKIRKAGL
jgi:hypothetical protein